MTVTLIEILRNPQRLYILPCGVDPRNDEQKDLWQDVQCKVGMARRWLDKQHTKREQFNEARRKMEERKDNAR